MTRVVRYHFANGSTMDEDLDAVPADATEEEVLKGIATAMTTRGDARLLVPLIVAKDRDRGQRPNLIVTGNLVRLELVDLP
jgi:hypothetical protein